MAIAKNVNVNNVETIVDKLDDLLSAILNDYVGVAEQKGEEVNMGDALAYWKANRGKVEEFVQANMTVKVEKPLRDPDAPKRPASAYLFFQKENREIIKDEKKLTDNQTISKAIGEKWRSLSDNDKRKWVAKAQCDKERYEADKSKYVKLSPEQILAKIQNKPKKANSKPKIKGIKQNRNAYIFFSQEMRPQIKDNFKEAKEVAAEIARLWKTDYSAPEARKKWVEEAENDLVRYQRQLKAYENGEEIVKEEVKKPVNKRAPKKNEEEKKEIVEEEEKKEDTKKKAPKDTKKKDTKKKDTKDTKKKDTKKKATKNDDDDTDNEDDTPAKSTRNRRTLAQTVKDEDESSDDEAMLSESDDE